MSPDNSPAKIMVINLCICSVIGASALSVLSELADASVAGSMSSGKFVDFK